VPYALGAVPLAAMLAAILAAARLFARFEAGHTLDAASARLVAAIGLLVAVSAVLGVAARAAAGACMAARAGDGALTVSVSSGDLVALGVGLLLVVLGRVLGEAAAVALENRQFV